MKFQVRESVKTQDSEVVLRALEMCSQEFSSDVVRHGNRITVRGLGPSPRSKNKHDVTVFSVDARNGDAIIQAEVNFQASALLGDTSQEDVVRSKLSDLFEQMRAQIKLDTLRVATYAAARKSAAGAVVVDRSEETDVEPPRVTKRSGEKMAASAAPSAVAPETLMEAMTAAPDSGWGAAALVAEPQADDSSPNLNERKGAVASRETFEPEKSAEADMPVAPEQRAQPRFYGEPELPEEEPTWQARTAPYRLRIEDDRMPGWKRFALWTVALLVLLAAGGGGYFYWLHRGIVASPARAAAPAVGVTANQPPKLDSRNAGENHPAKSDHTSAGVNPAAKTAPSSAPTPESATNSAELKMWLQNWAAAMRTKDANAQAAFYADTLDRYLNERNVGREAVLRDREATNRMRKGLWTVKMEDIVIERQTGSEAEVRLVKHFMNEQETSEILESFVPTRLTLRRLNGDWKITSEQDLPSLSVTPWKGRG